MLNVNYYMSNVCRLYKGSSSNNECSLCRSGACSNDWKLEWISFHYESKIIIRKRKKLRTFFRNNRQQNASWKNDARTLYYDDISSRYLNTVSFPFSLAICFAVYPKSFIIFGFAPFEIRSLHTSSWPQYAAKWRGVSSVSSWAFTFAPVFYKQRTFTR